MPRYPSDLSDDQWKVLEPQARAVMGELVIAAGRPMAHDLRAMVDAVGYVTRNGIEWRAMPADFPPWDAVYAFYQRWNARGLPQHLVTRLRGRLRERQGRQEKPTGCIIDSQIVKCADTVGKATSGYHGGKKITGRGRHLIVDTEGWLLALAVTAASASDKAGARLATARLIVLLSTLKVMWADTGYNGTPLRDWMTSTAGITLQIVARTSPVRRPFRPLTPESVRAVMARACDRAGMERRGTRRFRHALATQMLRAGASLPEVGQVLRHRSMLSTTIYAKVDQNALRPLARQWPGSAA